MVPTEDRRDRPVLSCTRFFEYHCSTFRRTKNRYIHARSPADLHPTQRDSPEGIPSGPFRKGIISIGVVCM